MIMCALEWLVYDHVRVGRQPSSGEQNRVQEPSDLLLRTGAGVGFLYSILYTKIISGTGERAYRKGMGSLKGKLGLVFTKLRVDYMKLHSAWSCYGWSGFYDLMETGRGTGRGDRDIHEANELE